MIFDGLSLLVLALVYTVFIPQMSVISHAWQRS
jgi:hypothetical protein